MFCVKNWKEKKKETVDKCTTCIFTLTDWVYAYLKLAITEMLGYKETIRLFYEVDLKPDVERKTVVLESDKN